MTSVSTATFSAGVAIGLAVAVPIGPMGLLCIQRTLAFGMIAGLATGLGAATVHLAFGSVAALGLGTAMTALLNGQSLTLVSACLLIWFASRTLRVTEVEGPDLPTEQGWLQSYASALLFGLSNPLTILLFAGAMPALSAASDLGTVPLLVAGVFLGSIAWWTVLSTVIAMIRNRFSTRAIVLANRASGLALGALGALMLATGLGLRS